MGATKFPDIFNRLAEPFVGSDVKNKPGRGGGRLDYITARTAMNRLDDVLGPENWWDSYQVWDQNSQNSVLCSLSLRLPDGQILTKSDVGGNAGMDDEGDDDKSGVSDAFKRTCVKFGVGRLLYKDGVPTYHRADANGDDQQPGQSALNRPSPSTAPSKQESIPQGNRPPALSSPARQPAPSSGGPDPRLGRLPVNGSQLFAWAKAMEDKHGFGVVKYLDTIARTEDFPPRYQQWKDDMVAYGVTEASNAIMHELNAREAAKADQERPQEPPQGNPEPVSPPQRSTPAVDKAAEFALKAGREKLIDLVWLLADRNVDKGATAGPEDYFKALTELDGLILVNHSEEMVIKGDINSCVNMTVLSAYIASAKSVIESPAIAL